MTLATTVPTFFIRLNPTSSMAKPACMNITKQAATITQTVSAATPAACVAVVSSASTAIGTSAASRATAPEIPITRRRRANAVRKSLANGNDVTSVFLPGAATSQCRLVRLSLRSVGGGQKRVDSTNRLGSALVPSHDEGTAVDKRFSCG